MVLPATSQLLAVVEAVAAEAAAVVTVMVAVAVAVEAIAKADAVAAVEAVVTVRADAAAEEAAVAVVTDQEPLPSMEVKARVPLLVRPTDQRPVAVARDSTSTLARLVRRLTHTTESPALALAART